MIPYAELSYILLSIILIVGVLLLFFGGEWLCSGAEAVALIFKINPIIIGLTIVAIATSMPELVTSFYGAATDSPGIAVGNIVGSNIANLGLILGIGAVIAPITVHVRLIRKEMPILMLVTLVFGLMAYGGVLSSIEGMFLILGTLIYLYRVVRSAKQEDAVVEESLGVDIESHRMSASKAGVAIILGALILNFGAEFMVKASVEIASRMGVDEVLIGLTLVAVGTSLPELAACISAARRGQSDLCIGNVVGSNLFNILLIGGAVSSVYPLTVEARLITWEFPIMLVLTGLVWFFIATQRKVTSKEGWLLIVFYFIIMGFTVYRSLDKL